MPLIPDVQSGQVIASSWGNAIRDRTVQYFDTFAALTSSWPNPPASALAIIADGTMYRRDGTRWVRWAPRLVSGRRQLNITLNASSTTSVAPSSQAGWYTTDANGLVTVLKAGIWSANASLSRADVAVDFRIQMTFPAAPTVVMLWPNYRPPGGGSTNVVAQFTGPLAANEQFSWVAYSSAGSGAATLRSSLTWQGDWTDTPPDGP